MGSYYKHTQTQSIKVPYSFRCEQCLRDSGMLEAVITGSANLNTHSKVLLDREQAKLSQLAHAALVREVQSVHREATQKQVYAAAFHPVPGRLSFLLSRPRRRYIMVLCRTL